MTREPEVIVTVALPLSVLLTIEQALAGQLYQTNIEMRSLRDMQLRAPYEATCRDLMRAGQFVGDAKRAATQAPGATLPPGVVAVDKPELATVSDLGHTAPRQTRS